MKKIHPAFFVFAVILLIFGYGLIFLVYLIAVIFHEFGHAIVASKLGYKLKNFYLMPYGACLSYEDFGFLESDEILIAIAGPLINVILGVIGISLWWIFPSSYLYTQNFVTINFVLAIFNFLPAFPLDGGRVLLATMSKNMPRNKAIKITLCFNYVFCIMFLILFFVSIFTLINFNFLIVALFLFISVFGGKFHGKYEHVYSFDKMKFLEKVIPSKIFALSSSTPLYKIHRKISRTKYSVFLIVSTSGKVKMISENAIKKLLEKNDLNLTFDQIIFE